jgi:transcriptional activator SPT7
MNPYPVPLPEDEMKEALSELWWAAAQPDTLPADGALDSISSASSEWKRLQASVPTLIFASSSSSLSSFFTFFRHRVHQHGNPHHHL